MTRFDPDRPKEPDDASPTMSGRRSEQATLCALVRQLQRRLVGDLEEDQPILEAILIASSQLPHPEQSCDLPDD